MRILCEVMTNDIFPGLRALIAKELINQYGISQKEAADLLGITQPAISQYIRSLRGKNILENDIVSKEVKRISKSLYENSLTKNDLPKEFCNIGKMLIDSKKLDAYKCDLC